MFQLKLFKSPASGFLAFTLLSFSACDGNRKYVLKRLPAGDDRSIIILADEMADISKGVYYELKIPGGLRTNRTGTTTPLGENFSKNCKRNFQTGNAN